MFNKETIRIEESLNVTFDESLSEPKSSPLVVDDRIHEQLTAYTNADWAGFSVTLSRSGEVANVVDETALVHNLLCELHAPLFTATLVYCDNVSAVYMSANLVQYQCTKLSP
ncbi:ribonuclease H-like domain-containing protein [Tanacetum coccineum]